MMVFPCPFGDVHPHHSGVRFGKRQESRNVNSAALPGEIARWSETTPTALCGSGSLESRPSSEKSSQNSIGEFHQRPCGQPRQTSVRLPGVLIELRTNSPRIGSSEGRSGLYMTSPE